MAKTKKQGENSACSALFEHAYYSSGYGIYYVWLGGGGSKHSCIIFWNRTFETTFVDLPLDQVINEQSPDQVINEQSPDQVINE